MYKFESNYSVAITRPELNFTLVSIEPTWIEKVHAKLSGIWYDIKTCSYFAISFVCFKFALTGHF